MALKFELAFSAATTGLGGSRTFRRNFDGEIYSIPLSAKIGKKIYHAISV